MPLFTAYIHIKCIIKKLLQIEFRIRGSSENVTEKSLLSTFQDSRPFSFD